MDMWRPYIQSTLMYVPEAQSKIAFDKFPVAQHQGDAVDRVRRAEHKDLLAAEGESILTRSRYPWLRHPDRKTNTSWRRLRVLKAFNLKTARSLGDQNPCDAPVGV